MDRHERFALLSREEATADREHGLPGRPRLQEGPVGIRPLPGGGVTRLMRVMQTYQAEHLLRQCGFGVDELVFGPDGNLALERDPKTAWALGHPARFPVELTRASREELLRVPGIGPRAADRILAERRGTVFRGAGDLRRLGVDVARGGHFMALAGHRLARRPAPEQLRLFPHRGHLPAVVWKTAVPPCAYR